VLRGKGPFSRDMSFVVGLGGISSCIKLFDGGCGDSEFARRKNLPESFADAGGSRHEGLRLNKKSRFKLINWHTGEPVVSFQPSFSFTSK